MATSAHAARSSKSAGFLFLLAFALLAAGAGFAYAPHYSWQVTQVARQAAALGLSNGALFVGGLVCFGLALVARAAGRGPELPDTRAESEALQSELHLLNEQLSTKLAQIRASLLQLGEGLATVSAQQQQALAEPRGPKEGVEDHAREAVFRLAASLDKLHAHFDERLHAVDLQLRSGFENLLHASHDVRRTLADPAAADFAPSIQQLDVPEHYPAPGHAHPHAHDAAGQAHGVPPDLALYETMQRLDAIAGEGELGNSYPASGAHEPQPGPALPSSGQDLDMLLPEEYRDRY
ncbi:MAG TPA: hypothetical protein VF530_09685 [Planctomycetota bacterium]